jgi:hypothetical protein
VVLFGAGVAPFDAWEFNGLTWTQRTPMASPAARVKGGLEYHAALNRFVLFGGITANDTLLADTWTLGFTSQVATEACYAGIDYDGDGLVGCADDDCWAVCTPVCPAGFQGSCLAEPSCGDAICTELEDCRSCPADCPVDDARCPIQCGDFFCDGPVESPATCPGDCN